VLNNLSPKAIQYKGDIEGWIIVVDDVNLKDEDKITTLRSLTSNEEERALTNWTVIDQEFAELEIKGKCCIWLSNVDVASDPQLANRFQIDCVDESEEQDASVFEFRLKKFAFEQHEKMIESIFEKWKPITDLLLSEKDSVMIPYFAFEDLLEWKNKADRRLFPQFATLVASITKAYKYQRERDKLGRLISTRQDFERALQIWDKIGEASASKLSEASRKVYNALDPEKHKTVSDIAKEIGKSTCAVRYNLKILTDIGVANSEQEEAGRRTWVFWSPERRLASASIKYDWDAFTLEKLLQNDSLIAVIPQERNLKDLYASLCLPLKSIARSDEMGQSIAKTTLESGVEGRVRSSKVVATDSEKNLATSKHSEIRRVDKVVATDSENNNTKDTTQNNNRGIGRMLDKITDRYSGYENTTSSRSKVKNDRSKDNLTIPYHDHATDFSKVKSLSIDTTTTTLLQKKGNIQNKTYKTEGNLEVEEIIPSKSDTVKQEPKKSDKNVK
jgi:predicted transcriptional regulator